jgi:hypothetical protein
MAGVKGVLGLLVSVAAIVVVAAGLYAVFDRMAADERGAERRALLARQADLTARALMPGSPLACLDGGAGETVGNACEKAVFAEATSAAAALSLTAARLVLLQEGAKLGDSDLTTAFAGVRRSIELDRFGLAAQVLADRDGCTPERCAAFALVSEAGALKANMKARVFEQYVSRYAAGWGRAAPEPVPQASVPVEPVPPAVASVAPPPPTGHPVDPKWDFPSAASIPPVSIMNSEPPRPKLKEGAGAQASQPAGEGEGVPVPPKRPQAQAPSAAQAR